MWCAARALRRKVWGRTHGPAAMGSVSEPASRPCVSRHVIRNPADFLTLHPGLTRRSYLVLSGRSMSTRRISSFDVRTTNRTFDVTPDGMQIVFDRLRVNSDLVLIDLPERTK